jgi:hypothetical protein
MISRTLALQERHASHLKMRLSGNGVLQAGLFPVIGWSPNSGIA